MGEEIWSLRMEPEMISDVLWAGSISSHDLVGFVRKS